MDIRHAQSWLDGYNNEDDVADSKNREIVINPYEVITYILITFMNKLL